MSDLTAQDYLDHWNECDERDRTPDMKFGAVLVFNSDTSAEQVQNFLDSLHREGIIEQKAELNQFDARYGGPVFYIP